MPPSASEGTRSANRPTGARLLASDVTSPSLCISVSDDHPPAAYHYNPVGYIALGASVQEPDLVATYERQEQIGYRSELIVGAADVDAHMKSLFPDWRAQLDGKPAPHEPAPVH